VKSCVLEKCCPVCQLSRPWRMSSKLGKKKFSREHGHCQFPIAQDTLQGQSSLWVTQHLHSIGNPWCEDAWVRKIKETISDFWLRYIFHPTKSAPSFFWSLTILNTREQGAHWRLAFKTDKQPRENSGWENLDLFLCIYTKHWTCLKCPNCC
jgi:hypothetical protein